jgi:hypothetical protein
MGAIFGRFAVAGQPGLFLSLLALEVFQEGEVLLVEAVSAAAQAELGEESPVLGAVGFEVVRVVLAQEVGGVWVEAC